MINRKASWRSGVLATVLAAGCGTAAATPAVPTPAPAATVPVVSRADQATTATMSPEQRREAYLKLVARIQAQTEAIYGRELGEPIHATILDPEGLSELLEKLLAQELKKPEVIGTEQVLKFLDLIPADTPLATIFQDLMEGQVGGLYNPSDDSLYVVGAYNPDSAVGQVILSHEIGHAIQDKHFDLTTYLEKVTDLDLQKARQCVVEGDATVLMMDWATKHASLASFLLSLGGFTEQMKGLEEAPPAIVQDMLFSYLKGMEFCQAARMRFGSAWRDEVYRNPPASTEQILHPEKYTGAVPDLPQTVALAQAPAGWKEIHRNTFGEWATRLFLTPPNAFPKLTMFSIDPVVAEPTATAAAAGWDGDCMVLLEEEGTGARLLLWKSVWDSERDAVEFHEAAERRIRMFPQFTSAAGESGRLHMGLRRRGDVVMVLLATSREARETGVQLMERIPATP